MVWDEELARVAQRWADQCRPGHDHSRNLDRFAVGQNVATTWTHNQESPSKGDPEFVRHIRGWFGEVKKFGFKMRHIDPFMFRMETGHYTQLAWAESYMVGCGYSYYKDPQRGMSKLYVCNYGPGGNFLGAPMYKIGFPGMLECSRHGDLKQSSKYLGLCDVQGVRYIDHMCSTVGTPPLVDTPPPHHSPTPRPHPSIFHQVMGDNALSDLAMNTSHMLMNGLRNTIDIGMSGVMDTVNLAGLGMKNTVHLAETGMRNTMDLAGDMMNNLLKG